LSLRDQTVVSSSSRDHIVLLLTQRLRHHRSLRTSRRTAPCLRSCRQPSEQHTGGALGISGAARAYSAAFRVLGRWSIYLPQAVARVPLPCLAASPGERLPPSVPTAAPVRSES